MDTPKPQKAKLSKRTLLPTEKAQTIMLSPPLSGAPGSQTHTLHATAPLGTPVNNATTTINNNTTSNSIMMPAISSPPLPSPFSSSSSSPASSLPPSLSSTSSASAPIFPSILQPQPSMPQQPSGVTPLASPPLPGGVAYCSSAPIRLNIGGYRYVTTKDTLLQVGKSHFFAVLLSGSMNPTVDEEGAYFVDRNGKYFEPLLDYLRTGILDIPPSMSRAHVMEQALFFGIEIKEFARDLVSEISQRQLVLIVNGLGGGKLQLPGYNLQDRSFAYLDLTNAILTGANLRGADFQEATLTRCDLRGADLERCNFSYANLKGAKIKGANLIRADLSHAYLQGADLREAKLTNANLQNADLQNANLFGAFLDNVHVKGARFRGCEGISGISLMCAQCGNMYQPATNNRRGVCPATLGSHFPAEVQPFECDDHLQPASPPAEPRASKKSLLSSFFTSFSGSSAPNPIPPSEQSFAASVFDAMARSPSPPSSHDLHPSISPRGSSRDP